MANIDMMNDRSSPGGRLPEYSDQPGLWVSERLEFAHPARGPDRLPSALQALASLMGAASIDLLYRASGNESVERLSSSLGGDADDDNVIALLPEHDSLDYVPVGQGVWLSSPSGAATILFVKLIERRTGTAWAAIRFHDGAAARRRLSGTLSVFITLLLSHATTVTTLEEARYQARAAMVALNQHDCGTFIVNADHTLLFANTAGQELLDQKLGFHLSRAKLRLLGYKDGMRFETALDLVLETERKTSRTGLALLLHIAGQERPMVIGIVPIDRNDTASGSGRAAALVYATLPRPGIERGLDVVCHVHGLSPVETQLVCHLVAGLTVAEAAVEMRVKVDTARAYLKQVFAKTSTNRQSSLVRLVTRYQRALRGNFAFTSI